MWQECKRGAAVLLAKSEAQAQELVARLQLHEAKSAQEILVVKNQVGTEPDVICVICFGDKQQWFQSKVLVNFPV